MATISSPLGPSPGSATVFCHFIHLETPRMMGKNIVAAFIFVLFYPNKSNRKIDGSINKLTEQHKKFSDLLSFARKYMLKYSICCHSHGRATWLISHCLQWFQRCLILAVLQPSQEFQLERRDFCLARQDSCLAWGWQLTFERHYNVELANAK